MKQHPVDVSLSLLVCKKNVTVCNLPLTSISLAVQSFAFFLQSPLPPKSQEHRSYSKPPSHTHHTAPARPFPPRTFLPLPELSITLPNLHGLTTSSKTPSTAKAKSLRPYFKDDRLDIHWEKRKDEAVNWLKEECRV